MTCDPHLHPSIAALPRWAIVVTLIFPTWPTTIYAQVESEWRVGSDPVFQVGLSVDDPRYQLSGVTAATRSRRGDVLIANGGSHQVFWYSTTGEFKTMLGREGDGPGEYRGITSVTIRRDSIFVFDSYWQRLTVYDESGEVAFDRRFDSPADDRIGILMGAGGNRWISRRVDRMRPVGPDGMSRDTVAYGVLDVATGQVSPVAISEGQWLSAGEFAGNRGYRPTPFSPIPQEDVAGECLVVSPGDVSEIRFYNLRGEQLTILPLPYNGLPVTSADFEAWFEAMTARVPPESLAQARGFLGALPRRDRKPVVGGLVVDALGYTWVQRWEVPFGESDAWTILEPSGATVTTISLPATMRVTEVGVDYVLGIGRGPYDEEVVQMYSLSRDPTPARWPSRLSACAAQ